MVSTPWSTRARTTISAPVRVSVFASASMVWVLMAVSFRDRVLDYLGWISGNKKGPRGAWACDRARRDLQITPIPAAQTLRGWRARVISPKERARCHAVL